jgi:hypothetical protein
MSNFVESKEELEVLKEMLLQLKIIKAHQEISTDEEIGIEDVED